MKKALHMSLFLFSLVFCLSTQASETEEENTNKVYMQYMGWFDETSTGSHWADGTTREPLIGYYDSQSWATHLYQILLSSACGVDGMVVNVRTEYDETSLKAVLPSLKRITDIDNSFEYSVAVNYSDEGLTQEEVETQLTALKNDIISTDNYLHKDGEPVIFFWDYGGYLTSDNYRTAISTVFTDDAPVLLRNEIDFDATVGSVNSYYPWVQGFNEEGTEWGEGYLNWYYNTINDKIASSEVDFSTGGVWAGFDDRDVSWGQNRWIDRNDGATYESIWDIVHAKSVDWVILQTWNDWNEGTELEPSVELGFTYVNKTATNIAEFKGGTSTLDEDLLSASTKVYEAALLIESETRDYDIYYPVLENAIQYFINSNGSAAIAELDKIIEDALATVPEETDPKVYMHYMGWFDETSSGSHWADGTSHEPLIGYYDSQSWATHLYQILLSSACGVDGMVVNVRTEYDETSLKAVLPSLQRIMDIDDTFEYAVAVSYDDQDMTQEAVETELTTLKNEIIPSTDHYLYKNEEPVIFIWDYSGFLTSENYRAAVANVFADESPILLRNEIEDSTDPNPINSYYPWVQGYADDGSNWGEDYLNWFYNTSNDRVTSGDIGFTTGGVWPGFDDRNASWGQDRWIDRNGGATYENTWDIVHAKSVDWVILETWNDWNEGTEIEPSVEHEFTYVNKTATNIAEFKGGTSTLDEDLLSASTKVYEAASLIESEARDYDTYYPVLEDAIQYFLNNDGNAASVELDKIIEDALSTDDKEPTQNDETKRVYMHYLGWFSEGKDGNHWKDGTAQEPIIGQYNSQSWATHLYHILLSSAVGVDGMVVNVRTEYDEESLKLVLPSLDRITEVKPEFDYTIAVSYDDQDMTQTSVEEELTTLKNDIIGETDHYMYKNGEPVIFVWNYDGFLTSDDYREAVSTVFTESSPVLLRNEIDFEASEEAIDSYYPWVQGFDDEGTIWGEDYLDWYYRTLEIREEITFTTGAVWPGFDDRNATWGQDRWIDRKDAETYQQTWDLVHSFNEDLPLNWIILETWNDWNEGTELEPSKEHGFTYMTKTAENIATFKDTEIAVDDDLFSASTKIYQAAQLIETEARDYDTFYPTLEQAIVKFVEKDAVGSIALSEEIINSGTVLGAFKETLALGLNIYPNPAKNETKFSLTLEQPQLVSIKVYGTGGELIDQVVAERLQAGRHQFNWNSKGQTGLFIVQIETHAGIEHRKLIVK